MSLVGVTNHNAQWACLEEVVIGFMVQDLGEETPREISAAPWPGAS